MRGAPGLVCSECGQDARTERNLLRTRRKRGPMFLALMCAAVAMHGVFSARRVAYDNEELGVALVPTTFFASAWTYLGPQWQRIGFERVGAQRDETPVSWGWQRDLFVRAGLWGLDDPQKDAQQTEYLLEMLAARPDRYLWTARLLAKYDRLADRHRSMLMQLYQRRVEQGDVHSILRMLDAHAEKVVGDYRVSRLVGGWSQDIWESFTDDEFRKAMAVSDESRSSTPTFRWYQGFDARLRALEKRPRLAREILPNLVGQLAASEPGWNSIAVVATQRKIDGQPCPLAVRTEPTSLRWVAGNSPVIHASLVNIDKTNPDQVQITYGGDNRGNRSERWRMKVRDSGGKPYLDLEASDNYGGKSIHGVLPPDKPYHIWLVLAAYIKRPPAGRYTVVIQYHDAEQISFLASVEHLIVFESAPIELIVE